MDRAPNPMDPLAQTVASAAEAGPPAFVPKRASDASTRELFYELLVLALGNLYTRMPIGCPLFDRAMIKAVTGHLADNDAGKLVGKAEDWIRQENLVRAQEGQKSYCLSLESIAALEYQTNSSSLGQLMEQAVLAYAAGSPSPDMRRATRKLASAFLTRYKT